MAESDLGVPIYTGIVTPGAYASSANLLAGTSWNFLQKGTITVVAKASAVNINVTMKLNGAPVVDDKNIIYLGTSGTLSTQDNKVSSIMVNAGTAELYVRNTGATAGTTCDVAVFWKPGK